MARHRKPEPLPSDQGPTRLAPRAEPVTPAGQKLPLHERLARAAREAERSGSAEAQMLNDILVPLQQARYKASQGPITSAAVRALVDEILSL